MEARVHEVWVDEAKRRFVLELAGTVSWRGARKPELNNDMANVAAVIDLELEHIAVPTLLVQGRVDTDVPPQHSEFAAARIPGIPGALLQWVERGGHLAEFTDHDSAAIQARIVQFLRRA